MDIITIFTQLLRWGLIAIIGLVVLSILYYIVFLIYKKMFHGKKSITIKQLIVFALISAWLFVVLGLTIFSRGASFTGSINITFLASYINAWNKWSLEEFQLIIFNMLMFAPLGFLLPLLSKKEEKFSMICLTSFLVTLGIETTQLITGRGIFEFDDLIHNFLGSLFGYFIIMAIINCVKSKKIKIKEILKVFIIPLIVGIIFLAILFGYNNQKYGNMSILPATKIDMSAVNIENRANLSDETTEVSIYKNKYTNDLENAKDISKKVEKLINNSFSKTIRTDGNDKVFTSRKGSLENFQLNYCMDNGCWSYTNWEETVKIDEDKLYVNKDKIESWLKDNKLLPNNTKYSLQNDDTLRYDIESPTNIINNENDYYYGNIMVQFDSENRINSIFYNINYNEFVGKEKVITSKLAYNEVLNGNFSQYVPFNQGDKLVIEKCELDYIYDTKGYYQPVYTFSGYINEKDIEWRCQIPALKK